MTQKIINEDILNLMNKRTIIPSSIRGLSFLKEYDYDRRPGALNSFYPLRIDLRILKFMLFVFYIISYHKALCNKK